MPIPWSYKPDPYTLYGMRVNISPDIPKMTLSKDVAVSEDFRIEMDRWMLDFFGVTNLIPDGQTIVMESIGCVAMNQRTYRQLRLAINANPT